MTRFVLQVTGPIPRGNGQFSWFVVVFDNAGRRIGDFEAETEDEVKYFVERLSIAFATDEHRS